MKFECCKASADSSTGSITCTKCKHNYHIHCLYPTEKRSTIAEIKKSWVCPVCSAKHPRPNSDNTPVRSSSRSQQHETDNVTAQRGGSSSITPPGLPDSPLSAETLRSIVASEVSKVKEEILAQVQRMLLQQLTPIKEDIENVKSSLNFFNEQFDSITKRLDIIENDQKSTKTAILDMNKLKSSMTKIEHSNNNIEQWSRRSNIEIYGIPERKNENLFDILNTIADRVQVKISPTIDIDFITRVAPKIADPKKTKPIIIRFIARYKKDDFLSRARRLKLKACDIGYTSCENPVFFNEHLTAFNKSLLHQAKNLAKAKEYNYVWVKNCTIFARKNDTSPVIAITNEEDLNKIK